MIAWCFSTVCLELSTYRLHSPWVLASQLFYGVSYTTNAIYSRWNEDHEQRIPMWIWDANAFTLRLYIHIQLYQPRRNLNEIETSFCYSCDAIARLTQAIAILLANEFWNDRRQFLPFLTPSLWGMVALAANAYLISSLKVHCEPIVYAKRAKLDTVDCR